MIEKGRYDYLYFFDLYKKVETLNKLDKEQEIIEGLLTLLKNHDYQSYKHTLIVEELSIELANEAGLSFEEIYLISNGAKLHDIGKLFVPSDVLKRQNNRFLNYKQYEILRKHAEMGVDIINSFTTPQGVLKVNPVYALIAEQHNIGGGLVLPTKEDLDRRHPLVPFITIADVLASTRDLGRTYQNTGNLLKIRDWIEDRFDRSVFPGSLRQPFNRLISKKRGQYFNSAT
ncbi:HD domain-containing protein [Candidatus Roizmanbacteria bacterium]|nr:HD domain-containing protein [Candidatus Roizmanbacteria bacterium]